MRRDDRINATLDVLRSRFGSDIVMRGTQMEGKDDLVDPDREDHPHGGFLEDL